MCLCRKYESEKATHVESSSQPFPIFSAWIRETIREHQRHHPDMDKDLLLLSNAPRQKVLTYKAMTAYGNHYRVVDRTSDHFVSYDSGLLTVVEQPQNEQGRGRIEMGYVGELTGIWVLEYDNTSQPIILMKGSWVRPQWRGARPTMKRDGDGFLLANVNQRLPEWSEPFVFPNQVEQAFFLDVEDAPGWKVVCHSQARNRRMEGLTLQFTLNAHEAFERPRQPPTGGIAVGGDYIPLTVVEMFEGDAEILEVDDGV